MLHTRRECIKDMLNSAGFVNVQELVTRFQVSSETIRRDLEYLEKEGLVKRIHGGAVSVRPHANESAYHTRQQACHCPAPGGCRGFPIRPWTEQISFPYHHPRSLLDR